MSTVENAEKVDKNNCNSSLNSDLNKVQDEQFWEAGKDCLFTLKSKLEILKDVTDPNLLWKTLIILLSDDKSLSAIEGLKNLTDPKIYKNDELANALIKNKYNTGTPIFNQNQAAQLLNLLSNKNPNYKKAQDKAQTQIDAEKRIADEKRMDTVTKQAADLNRQRTHNLNNSDSERRARANKNRLEENQVAEAARIKLENEAKEEQTALRMKNMALRMKNMALEFKEEETAKLLQQTADPNLNATTLTASPNAAAAVQKKQVVASDAMENFVNNSVKAAIQNLNTMLIIKVCVKDNKLYFDLSENTFDKSETGDNVITFDKEHDVVTAIIKTMEKNNEFKQFLTAFNTSYLVNQSTESKSSSGSFPVMTIKLTIDNKDVKINLEFGNIASNDSSGFKKIDQTSFETILQIITEFTPPQLDPQSPLLSFLKRFHTAYNTKPPN